MRFEWDAKLDFFAHAFLESDDFLFLFQPFPLEKEGKIISPFCRCSKSKEIDDRKRKEKSTN